MLKGISVRSIVIGLFFLFIFIMSISCPETDSSKNKDAKRKELNQLAECVCSNKGGVHYIRYNGARAEVLCNTTGSEVFNIYRDDYCKQ